MNLSDPLECVILGKYYKGDIRMFHKIKSVTALNNYQLFVQFCDGVTKGFDVKPLFDRWEPLRALETIPGLFCCVQVDAGGYGVTWNDDLDISCEELWENGVPRA